jgi:hypothetical protein
MRADRPIRRAALGAALAATAALALLSAAHGGRLAHLGRAAASGERGAAAWSAADPQPSPTTRSGACLLCLGASHARTLLARTPTSRVPGANAGAPAPVPERSDAAPRRLVAAPAAPRAPPSA